MFGICPNGRALPVWVVVRRLAWALDKEDIEVSALDKLAGVDNTLGKVIFPTFLVLKMSVNTFLCILHYDYCNWGQD